MSPILVTSLSVLFIIEKEKGAKIYWKMADIQHFGAKFLTLVYCLHFLCINELFRTLCGYWGLGE